MKKLTAFLAFLLIVSFNGTLLAETYYGVEVPEGASSFADEVFSYSPGPGVGSSFLDPQNAIGEPDHPDDNLVNPLSDVSLGDGGVLTVRFTDNSLTTSGDNDNDLWLFEIGFVEPSNIAISTDGNTWIDVGSVEGSISGIDIDNFLDSGVVLWRKYSYVKITDAGAGISDQYEFPGVDIDAIAAISSTPPEEYLPEAAAGGNQAISEGDSVTLDGTNSAAPDGRNIVSYLWEQLGGTSVTLSGDSTDTAIFTAPDATGALEFQLTVEDSEGYSDTDQCIVNVGEGAPIVSISPALKSVLENVSVTLSSNYSSDVLSFEWTQVSGTSVTLSGDSTDTVTFTSPNVGASGEALEFELTVTDDDNLKASASSIVNVSNVNQPPVVDAGDTQTMAKGVSVTLYGSATDPDSGDTLTYSWTQISGTAVTLSDPMTSQPTFPAPDSDESIALEFQLTVTDNGGLQATDICIVNVTDGTIPTADAGANQNVLPGTSVTLDGTSSTDGDGGTTLEYFWRQLSGTAVTLSDPTSAQPTFTAPSAEDTLEFELTVTDSTGLKDNDSCTISVSIGEDSDGGNCFINSTGWNILR